jgi:hypothetical protein
MVVTIGIVGHVVVPMALFAETNFSVAAFCEYDGLAPDGICTDDDHPAAGEGPVHRSDLGDEGSGNRIKRLAVC